MRIRATVLGTNALRSATGKLPEVLSNALTKALITGAQRVEREAKLSISRGNRSGRVYKRGRRSHQASAPGEAPKSDRGTLVNSIHVTWNENQGKVLSASIGSNLKYAHALEFGTRKMGERPWLYPALQKTRDQNVKLITAAARDAIQKFAKGKAGG